MLGEIEYLRRNKDRPLQSDLVFGITMLAKSSKAFLWKGEDINPVNCRIRALAMTGEIYKSVEEMRKTEEDDLLASASNGTSFVTVLANFSELLTLSQSTPRFSLYHQSPWVAGGEMSAILGNAQILGLTLLSQEGFFGTFLHAYNMLVEIHMLPRMEPWEAICKLCLDEVFKGSRPKKNFTPNLLRFYSVSSLAAKASRNPVHAQMREMRSKTKPRINPLNISVFINQFFLSSHIDEFQTGKLAANLNIKFPRSSSSFSKWEELYTKFGDFSKIFHRMQEQLEDEFAGELSIAKLNCFRVYKMCLEVWKIITLHHSTPLHIMGDLERLMHPAYPEDLFADLLFHLRAATTVDGVKKHSTGTVDFTDSLPLKVMSDAIVKVWAGKPMEEFVWKEV